MDNHKLNKKFYVITPGEDKDKYMFDEEFLIITPEYQIFLNFSLSYLELIYSPVAIPLTVIEIENQHLVLGAILKWIQVQKDLTNCDQEKLTRYFNALGHNLNIRNTIEVISHLPFLYAEYFHPATLEIYKKVSYCMKIWLLRKTNQISDISENFDDIKASEPQAMVMIRRYQLISALFDRSILDKKLLNAELCWLFAETAIFRLSLTSNITRYQHYNDYKKYNDRLNRLDVKLETDETSSLNTRINFFHQGIDGIGHATAREDTNFDKLYWQPYILAKRRFATQCKNDKSLKPIRPDNKPLKETRGRKLGSKNKPKG
jgi:hypothetical protein